MLQTCTASNNISFESENTLNSAIMRNLYSQTSHSDSNISQIIYEISQNIVLPIGYKKCYSCSFQIKSGQYPEFKLVDGKFALGTLIL